MNKAIFYTAAFLAFALTLGPSAYAGQGDARVSNSVLDQYVEMIPNPGGDTVPGSDNTSNPPKGSNPLGPALENLAQSGPDGELAAAVALATSVVAEDPRTTAGGSSDKADNELPNGKAKAPSDASSSAPLDSDTEFSGVGAVVSGVTGDGLGLVLPVLLILTLVGVAGIRLAAKPHDSA